MKNAITLQEGEEMILLLRKHWFIFILRLLSVLLAAVLPFIGYAYLSNIGAITSAAETSHVGAFLALWWLVIILWSISMLWMQYYLEMWVVTNMRVMSTEQKGLFYRDVTEWNIERVQEVNVETENIIQAFLDYGTLEIRTPGLNDEHERVTGIPHPAQVRDAIMAQTSRIAPLIEANKNQEVLIHAIGHEVKSYLTKDAASFATIAEGDAGPVVPQVESFAESALGETRKGVSAVMSILKGSDAKTGRIAVGDSLFDIAAAIRNLSAELKPYAEKKGLKFSLTVPGGTCMVRGDEKRVMDLVFRNVLENAINYTLIGSIQILLSLSPNSVICTITDTGVGISESDMQKLFTEGGRGEHSLEVNPDSTGYGLSTAKTTLEAHGGSIHAISDGPGKGATFVITLPLSS